jgi:hypothetical protein
MMGGEEEEVAANPRIVISPTRLRMTQPSARGSNDLMLVAEELGAVPYGDAPLGATSRLGAALVGLAQDLAAARREIAALKRENAALRSHLGGRAGPAGR